MIDVIIPAYNAHDTLFQTLANLAIQTIKDKMIVYIIDDNSNKNYHDIVLFFKDKLKIIELRTPKNGGPGKARQFGIDNSKSEYIIIQVSKGFIIINRRKHLLLFDIQKSYRN